MIPLHISFSHPDWRLIHVRPLCSFCIDQHKQKLKMSPALGPLCTCWTNLLERLNMPVLLLMVPGPSPATHKILHRFMAMIWPAWREGEVERSTTGINTKMEVVTMRAEWFEVTQQMDLTNDKLNLRWKISCILPAFPVCPPRDAVVDSPVRHLRTANMGSETLNTFGFVITHLVSDISRSNISSFQTNGQNVRIVVSCVHDWTSFKSLQGISLCVCVCVCELTHVHCGEGGFIFVFVHSCSPDASLHM